MKRSTQRSRRQRKQEGAAALEFALVLPLLVVLLFGIIDFGYLMFVVSTMNNAAREGARRGAVFGDSSRTAVEQTVAIQDAARGAANRYLALAGLGPGCRVNCPTVASSLFQPPVGATPGAITVTVSLAQVRGISGFTYAVLPGMTSPFTRMGTLRAVSQMRWELSP